MTSWRYATLESLASSEKDSFVDGPFGSSLKADEYVDSGVPIIRLQNIKPNRFVSKQIKYITEAKARELSRHSYRPGDVAIAKLGDPCGMACVLPEVAGAGRIVADVVRFRGNPDLIDHRYLCYFINAPAGQSEISKDAKGATRQRVNLGNFKKLFVHLPNVAEQRHIASILDKADALIAKRRESLAHLDSLTHSIFIEMFGDPVSNPMSWTCRTLDEVTEKVTDGEHLNPVFSDSGMPIVMAGNVLVDQVDVSNAKRVETSLGQQFRKKCGPELGDLLIVGRGATIGRLCRINIHDIFCLMGSVILVKPNRSVLDEHYLAGMLGLPSMHAMLYNTSGSSAQQAIYLKDVKKLVCPLPPLALQLTFATRIQAVEVLKATHRTALLELDRLFASLQHRAFAREL
jgi:type I restriction enzyme S subunit